ncbi:hypothetical protein GN244_ATG12018 [Phytophthora infestans]|uniref:Ankyrin repeat protein n=1 Tax=Phytophthora infestans TaxID=4787 RepID=A0A833VZX9_PHYIN|nr:hypothetical protein GN244_ATG12018 [Phytophthora infestans]
MESSAIDYSSMPTRKEILQAFLPSRVAAFTNVIESIDQFAMTPKEAAVLAARNGNVELVRCFLDHVQYDMESVVTAAVETGQSKILDMIWSETRLWCMEIAIRKSKQIRVVKLLYEWLKARGAARRVLRIVLTKSASRGLLDIFEFAIENYVWEFWNKILTQSLSRGARTPGRNQLGRYLDWSPSLQRLFNYAFYKALENVHEDIAGMIYAAYPAYHVRIRDKLLASLVQLVNFLWGQAWIPYEHFVAVFVDAAKHGCLETVQWFNSYNRASRESITAAFAAAAEGGYTRVVKLLFDKQHSSSETISVLINHASTQHHYLLMDFLLEKKHEALS